MRWRARKSSRATARSPNGTFAAPIFHNVVPQVGSFTGVGDSGEEEKVAQETRKTLNRPDLHVAATCVRVPVRRAHSEAVFFETERDDERRGTGRRAASAARGVVFHDRGIVTPRDVEDSDLVHVARLRAEGDDDSRHFRCGSSATSCAKARRPTACRSSNC